MHNKDMKNMLLAEKKTLNNYKENRWKRQRSQSKKNPAQSVLDVKNQKNGVEKVVNDIIQHCLKCKKSWIQNTSCSRKKKIHSEWSAPWYVLIK